MCTAALSAVSFFQCLGRSESWEWGWGRAVVSTGVAVYTIRSLEQFCLFLGLGRLDLAVVCRNYSSLFRNSVCRSILRAQLLHQSPGEMRCRDVSVPVPGALVHVGGEAEGVQGGTQQCWQCCECLLVTVLPLQGSSQVPRKQVACGFWQEIPTGLCQVHFYMKIPMFSLLLVNNLAALTCCIHSCRFDLSKFPFMWQNFSLLINCCWSTNGLHWK